MLLTVQIKSRIMKGIDYSMANSVIFIHSLAHRLGNTAIVFFMQVVP